jgi:NCS2 family nucleobase:cation symporter-2
VSLGVGLFGVAITWAGGGHGAKDFGSLVYLGIAGTVLLVTLLVARFGRGFFGSIAVLVGLAAGMILAILMGRVTVEGLDQLPWIELVTPFHFGMPTFSFSATFTMLLVVIVTMVEAIGLFYALAVILNRPLSHEDFARGLRADALGAVIGGVFNTFPYSSYAQNIGLIGVTGVRSRYVCLVAGLILIVLGLVPRIAHVVALVPHYVLGGAAIVMFGMVAASGVRILQTVDFKNNKHNTFIFAISLGVGLIPAVAPTFFDQFPEYLIPLLHSGVLLTVISSVVLNLFFNGTSGRQHTEELVMETQEETPLSVVRVTPQG